LFCCFAAAAVGLEAKMRCGFELRDGDELFQFIAPTAEERDEWMAEIKTIIRDYMRQQFGMCWHACMHYTTAVGCHKLTLEYVYCMAQLRLRRKRKSKPSSARSKQVPQCSAMAPICIMYCRNLPVVVGQNSSCSRRRCRRSFVGSFVRSFVHYVLCLSYSL
jgi:hypothetical protein